MQGTGNNEVQSEWCVWVFLVDCISQGKVQVNTKGMLVSNSKYTSARKLRPYPYCRAQGFINKKTNPPTVRHTKTAVRIPAPALSAVVIGANVSGPDVFLVPEFGSLEPFPPVAVDTGFEESPRNFSITALMIWLPLMAFSIEFCSSYPPYQWFPQRFSLFPVHEFAAPLAETWSLGRIFSLSSGMINAISESQDTVRPLKSGPLAST